MKNTWIEQDWEREALKDSIYSLERRIEEEDTLKTDVRIKIIIHKTKKTQNDSTDIRENYKERI